MDEQQAEQDPVNFILSEFGTKINEIEEKQRLIKDRILLIGENLISVKEEFEKQDSEFKKQLKDIEAEIKSIKQVNRRVIDEISNFARKNEVEILNRQMKMFQPLELDRVEDIKKIVQEEIEKNIKREVEK